LSHEWWNPPITSERVQLSPLMPDDAGELVDVLSDPRLYRFTGEAPTDLEGLRDRFERWATRHSPDGRERWLNWVIRDRQTGMALGTLQATVRPEEPKPVADVAWVLGVEAQGHGYASEAARALVAHLASKGIREFTAHIHPNHVASNRVASAIGMQPTEEWSAGERVWRLSNLPADTHRQ
jgi:RimJ/RimL family protein N-acetyltransferase